MMTDLPADLDDLARLVVTLIPATPKMRCWPHLSPRSTTRRVSPRSPPWNEQAA